MKGYIVTLFNLPQSVRVAKRCLKSARRFGVEAKLFPAVYKDKSLDELKKEKLEIADYDHSYSKQGSVMGNFVTQYRIWKAIVKSGEPGIVLEHDAVFIDFVPDLTDKGEIINLGKPSYGKFKRKKKPGVYPMFSKDKGYIPGAHGYYLTVEGARQLIAKAKEVGAAPCDLFLNRKKFPQIKEIYPWVIVANDKFSTIQNEKGCLKKHNFDEDFKIL